LSDTTEVLTPRVEPALPSEGPVLSTPTADAEYDAGRRSVARTMRIGGWIWPAYTLLDVYMCFVAFPDARFRLFILYRVVIELAFVGVYRASVRGTLSLRRLVLLQDATYVAAAVAIALMALELGGIRSPYMHGISIVALVRTALVPTHWRKGLSTYAGIALGFPIVMAIAAGVSPVAREEWLSSASLIVFASNYIFVITSSILGLITGHIVWSAQEQLYRARKVGRYRLQAPIGKGGMGEVWLAWDESLHRNVALKLLRVSATSPAAVRRFELEAQAAGRLRGTHVVRIFDYGASDDGLYYIAMEYLTGMSLASVIEKFGPLPQARAIHIALQACLALEEAHGAGIIHRDLKPHNLHLTHMPDELDFVKLLDFGIARLREASQTEPLTVAGLMVGTPSYLAPELWLGGVADERSDIYSFGVTLHVMLTGVTPFEGWSLQQLQIAHVRGMPPALRVPNGSRIGDILLKCLARSPDDRMQTVRELRERLSEIHDASEWTQTDADEFWKKADNSRFG
jgi:serine/threonine-protein kinase